MLEYDCFIEKVNEAGFYTPFINYLNPDTKGNEYNSDIERGWRIRATQEKKLACGYFFNGKPGYIAPRYFSIFIDAFRPNITIEEMYESGKLGRYERDIWNLLNQYDKPLSWSDFWKKLNVKDKVERRKLESALFQLQMMFYVAINGGINDVSKSTGEIYAQFLGYDKIDNWVPVEWMEMNPRMGHEEALEIIYCQAEKISKSGEAQKAFKESYKLYKI